MRRAAWLLVAAACAVAALAAAALSQAYRGTLVRALHERHPAEWAAVGRPAERGAGRELALLGWVRTRRYFVLDDADLVSAARNFYYDRAAAYVLAAAAAGALLAAVRPRT